MLSKQVIGLIDACLFWLSITHQANPQLHSGFEYYLYSEAIRGLSIAMLKNNLDSFKHHICLQIIIKWVCFSAHPGYIFGFYYPSTNCAPSLLIGLINMFMLKSREAGFVDNNKPDESGNTVELDQCHLQQWYPNQVINSITLLNSSVFDGHIC